MEKAVYMRNEEMAIEEENTDGVTGMKATCRTTDEQQ